MLPTTHILDHMLSVSVNWLLKKKRCHQICLFGIEKLIWFTFLCASFVGLWYRKGHTLVFSFASSSLCFLLTMKFFDYHKLLTREKLNRWLILSDGLICKHNQLNNFNNNKFWDNLFCKINEEQYFLKKKLPSQSIPPIYTWK